LSSPWWNEEIPISKTQWKSLIDNNRVLLTIEKEANMRDLPKMREKRCKISTDMFIRQRPLKLPMPK
jgi:hypothetical protein